MDDEELLARIAHLVAEEHALESQPGHALTGDEKARLRALEISLDQTWDLLHQRRARRRAGMDPDVASERPAEQVEGYQQ